MGIFYDLVLQFQKIKPIIFDTGKNFYLWTSAGYYERIEETDIINAIREYAMENYVNRKTREQIIKGIRQTGRKRIRNIKPIKKIWIHTLSGGK